MSASHSEDSKEGRIGGNVYWKVMEVDGKEVYSVNNLAPDSGG